MTDGPMQLEHVSFTYHPGDRPAVSDVCLSARPGRIHALIGPNAAGKSTLMKLMLGRLSATRGRVLLSGIPVDQYSGADRAAWMSYVPQRSQTGFAFTVEQVVAMGRYALAWDPIAVRQSLADCDLSGIAGRPYLDLSVGQQQRVLLARALAQSAGSGRIMLLDEPTSAMDLRRAHQTMSLLRRLAGDGLSVVVVLHDLNMVARYADDVWLMDRGRLVIADCWQQVLRSAILEPVYHVQIHELVHESAESGRPVFQISLPA